MSERFEPALHEPSSPGSSPLQRVSVRWVDPEDAERLWLAVATDAGVAAWASEDGGQTLREWATGERSVHGPVPLCGGHVALVDGALVSDPATPLSCSLASLEGHQLTCLGRRGELTYACEARRIQRLVSLDGQLVLEDVFGLEQIAGPSDHCPVDEDARQKNQIDWQHFGWEAGLVDPTAGPEIGEGPDSGEATDSSGGCSVSLSAVSKSLGFRLAVSSLGRLGWRAYWMGR